MNIETIIKEQEKFVTQVALTLLFLKSYANNPKQFELLFSSNILEDCEYHKYKTNVDYLWETLDELASDIANGDKKVVIKQTGIYPCLAYALAKTRKSTVEEIIKEFSPFASGPWLI